MAELILAAAFMLASHVGLSSLAVRARLVAVLGRRGFRSLYSVVTLGAMAWMIVAYGNAPFVEVWPQAAWMRMIPVLLMPLACILVVAGLTSAGVSISSDVALPGSEDITGILKVTRHPVMWALILWAGAHLAPNGDAAGLVLFGVFLALALAGPMLIDAKRARIHGSDWKRFAGETSAVPFAAIIGGRARVTFSTWGAEIGWSRIAGGLALYGILLAAHEWVIGVTPYP